MKKSIIPLLIAAAFPIISNAASVNYDRSSGADAAEQVSLTTYILNAITSITGGNAQQERLKGCVDKISAFAPGGGDSSRQQRGYSGTVPLPRVMSAALTKAAPFNRAANTCAVSLNNLSIVFPNKNAEVMIGRNGAPYDPGQYAELQGVISQRVVCALALSEMSAQIESSLAQNPPKTEDEAVLKVSAIIADNMHLATKRVATHDVLRPDYTIGDNGGSTRPYNPLTPSTTNMNKGDGSSVSFSGQQTSQLAATNMGISAVAVGGIFTYTTRPTEGYVATYDGKALSITKDGIPYYDASTLGGRKGTVTISGTDAYAASVKETDPAFRSAAIAEVSVCGLALNDVANQAALKFLKPNVLPSFSSKFTQNIIKTADISGAFKKAEVLIKGKPVDQDLDGRGSAWRVGDYAFEMSKANLSVVYGGQPFFDPNHISGRGYTVKASSAGSTSSGYKGESK